MPNLKEIADNSQLIVNGYSFTEDNDYIKVLNLNHPDKAAVFLQSGEVSETSMDDIELKIVSDYFHKNKKYMD